MLFVLSVSILTIFSCQKDNQAVDSTKDLTCSVSSTNVTTNGGHDGTITVTVLTGNGDYLYSINSTTNNTNGLFTQLSAGVYNVKVVDKEDKTFEKSVTITEPDVVPVKPTVETSAATLITSTTVTLNGKVNPNGFNTILVKFEYGTSTSYGTTVTLSNVNGNTLTNVSSNLTNLTPNTTYHYRLVSTNVGGTTNGSDMSFTTSGIGPTVTTSSAMNITSTSSVIIGSVNPQGSNVTSLYFEYGETTSYGSTKTVDINQFQVNVILTLPTTVNAGLDNLLPNKTYHYRLVATNGGGTTYGNDVQFTTLNAVPTVTTLSATNITSSSVTFNGSVNVNGGSTVTVKFEYGETTSYGSTVDATPSTVSGITTTDVSVNLTNLDFKTYHYRVITLSTDGLNTKTVGNDMIFTRQLSVGSQLYGGIVFEVSGTYPNQTGKVVQKTDYNGGSLSAYPGDGTIQTSNGKDWRLPSFIEFQTMYNNVIINSIVSLHPSAPYWANDKNPNNTNERAWFACTNPNPPNLSYYNKSNLIKIRLITTF